MFSRGNLAKLGKNITDVRKRQRQNSGLECVCPPACPYLPVFLCRCDVKTVTDTVTVMW